MNRKEFIYHSSYIFIASVASNFISCKNFALTLRSFQMFYDAIYGNCLDHELKQKNRRENQRVQIKVNAAFQ